MQVGAKYVIAIALLDLPNDTSTEYICSRCGKFYLTGEAACTACKYNVVKTYNISNLRNNIEALLLQSDSREREETPIKNNTTQITVEKLGFHEYEVYEYVTDDKYKPWFVSSQSYIRSSVKQVSIVIDIEQLSKMQRMDKVMADWEMFQKGKRWVRMREPPDRPVEENGKKTIDLKQLKSYYCLL